MVMVYTLYAFYSGKLVILKVKNKLVVFGMRFRKRYTWKFSIFTDGFYIISSLFKESHLPVPIKSLTHW